MGAEIEPTDVSLSKCKCEAAKRMIETGKSRRLPFPLAACQWAAAWRGVILRTVQRSELPTAQSSPAHN